MIHNRITIFSIHQSIPPEKINWTLYFGHIVTLDIYFKRNNIIFWKSVKFSIFLHKYVLICIRVWKIKWLLTRTTPSVDSQKLNFVIVFSHSIFNFLSLLQNFISKINIYSDSALNSLTSYIFISHMVFVPWKRIRR